MEPRRTSVPGRVARVGLLVGVLLGGTACASTGGSGDGGDPSRITREQALAYPDYTNAMQLIRRIRPQWLRTQRAPSSFGSSEPEEPVVYVDGVRRGGISALDGILLTTVESMDFLRGPDAMTRYGTGHGGGAIRIVTMRRRD